MVVAAVEVDLVASHCRRSTRDVAFAELVANFGKVVLAVRTVRAFDQREDTLDHRTVRDTNGGVVATTELGLA